jgi:hypothetical protein
LFNGTSGDYDASGSRIVPAFADPQKNPSCISLYGDSFTLGGEVGHADTWGNVLSGLLHCRVANYGVGGYGTDQAYLRFHENTRDNAGIVILGVLSENILRNVNRYRPLLYHSSDGAGKFGLKPRFVITGNSQLRLVPLPALSYEEMLRTINWPEKYLEDEYFIPGGKSGIVRGKFPYTLTIIRVLARNFHIQAAIRGVPWYKDFYEKNHPSGGLMVTFGIVEEFCREAKERHKVPVILLIPSGLDLVYYDTAGEWTYSNLRVLLEQNGVEFLDAGPKFIEYLGGKDPKILFKNYRAHFNKAGEEALARIVYAYLKEKRIIGAK